MQQKDIVIGGRYQAKVGNRVATVVVVRCLGQQRANRWTFECVTEDTRRTIKATGQRLRPLDGGPRSIEDPEMLDRLQPAVEEYRDLVAQKKDRQDATARKHGRDFSAVARKAGFTKKELLAKLARLKSLIRHDEGTVLAIEFIKAAEPWLLESLLTGAAVRRITNAYGHAALEWDPGTFFRPLFRSSSQKDSCWESNQAGSPFWIPFWLTVVRATAERCCPTDCRLHDVWRFTASVDRESDFATVANDILPAMVDLQQLTLRIGRFRFSTTSLPALPSLATLICEATDERYEITVEALQCRPKLQAIILQDRVGLEIAADQEPLFQRIRLETSQGGYQQGDDGLRMLDKPPEMHPCVTHVNTTAARVLATMARDYTSAANPPAWWNPGWVTTEWWHEIYGEGQTVYGTRSYPLHGRVDLSLCESVANEVVAELRSTGVPLVLPG